MPKRKQRPEPTPAKVWITKNGREIPIPMLTDNHAVNIINFMRRNRPFVWERFDAVIPIVSYLSTDPPDGASYAAEGEIDAILTGCMDEELRKENIRGYKEVLAEVKRRKLTDLLL